MGKIFRSKLQFNSCFSDLTITGSTAGVNILEDKTFTQVPALEETLERGQGPPASATTGGRRARAVGGTALVTTSTATTTTTSTTGQCQAFRIRTASTETRRLITDQPAVGMITSNFVSTVFKTFIKICFFVLI